MLSDFTESSHTAGSWTGVDTLLGDAGEGGGTVRVLQTLGPAAEARQRISLEARAAGTDNLATPVLTALSVGATGRGLAGVDRSAALEGVASKPGVALAVLTRVGHQTLCVLSTRPGLTEVSQSRRDAALDGVDGLSEAWLAGTPLDVVHHHALRVQAAGIGLARLDRADAGDGGWIALVPGQAVAHRSVSNHPTAGVGAALITATLQTVCDTFVEGVSSLAAGAGTDGVPGLAVKLTHGVDTAG